MIGYYIHHQGRGHLTRALGVTAQLDRPVVGLSSLPPPDHGSAFAGWVQLARDDAGAVPDDPQAHGALHWAPRADAGLRQRMSAIATWVEQARPAAVVVDVSVEVAAFLRLLGVPVVVVVLPGDRGDAPHQLAFRLADAILAFWPRDAYSPPWLAPHDERTHFVGAASRFDGRRRPRFTERARPRAVLFGGTGGSVITGQQYAELPTTWDWQLLTAGGESARTWVQDPWPVLCGADVVVTHAGQNALAEVAAAGRPAVVLPQPRPFREQERTAAALAAAGIAHVPGQWPAGGDWSAVLAQAKALGGAAWTRWCRGDAAGRAAAVITAVAA